MIKGHENKALWINIKAAARLSIGSVHRRFVASRHGDQRCRGLERPHSPCMRAMPSPQPI